MKEDLYKNPIFIFDFDNTLIKPEAKIIVKKKNGEIVLLQSHDYDQYTFEKDDIVDFSEFESSNKYKIIKKTFSRLKLLYKFYSPSQILILSARQSPVEIFQFLLDQNLLNIKVSALGVPLGKNNGIYKANEIEEILNTRNIDYIEFYDDRTDCIKEVSKLKTKYKNCKFRIFQVINSSHITEI